MSRPARRVAALACVAALGCAGGSGGYRAGLAEGDRAYRSGRFAAAAVAYERAAGLAVARRDSDDAHYRAAMACRRGGDRACARRNLTGVAVGGGEWDHGPRARYELAALDLEGASATEVDAARAELQRLVVDAPETGPARAALRRELRARDLADPTLANSIAWLARLAEVPAVRGSSLWESVLAERATRVETGRPPAEAEAAWRAVVDCRPYPQNSHWDDGHLALARVQRAAGRPREAIATLRRMLAVREASWGNGSYAAPRFDDGAMLEAEILRDDLRDDAAAADAYHRVYAEHATSLRRDDALWEESLLRARTDRAAACRVWATLVAEFPCQRFAVRARRSLGGCGVVVPPAAGCGAGG